MICADMDAHRWEFRGCENYEEKWICLNCSEQMTQYRDCGSGG